PTSLVPILTSQGIKAINTYNSMSAFSTNVFNIRSGSTDGFQYLSAAMRISILLCRQKSSRAQHNIKTMLGFSSTVRTASHIT
ncbi:hypothetical protein, partial [Paraclostridium dentum]|uniref:hypothetical protein n=1 Tax=Paraclostridium dentum TaxID=2662455 RepID=UPI003F303250